MTHTQSTEEPSTGTLPVDSTGDSQDDLAQQHTPRTQARLDAAHDAELLRVDADRQYNECLLDAPVVVYGSGRGCVAVVPAIRNVNPDASGEWVLQPAKTGKTLQRWRGSIVGVYRRGYCPDTAMWKLSNEQATALDSFDWLSDIDKTLRGCATKENEDYQASIETESKNVMNIAQLCEMVHTEQALAAKTCYMEYYHFLNRYRKYHQPFDQTGEAAEPTVTEDEAPGQLPESVDEAPKKRAADDLFAEMQAQDQQSFSAETAKRRRQEPSLDDDPGFAAAMDALVASTSTDDDDAGSTSSGSDVAAPRHMAPLDTAAIDEYTAAVRKTVHIGEDAIYQLRETIDRIADETRRADKDADPEDVRLAVREQVASSHKCRQALFKASEAVRVACESGYHAGGNGETYEAVRNDWCHVTFDEGPYRVDMSDGGCVLRLARTNKEGTKAYAQDIAEHSPDLYHLLDDYRAIAKALVPAGESAAPVICVTDGKQQDRVGGMLATEDEDAHCGYNDSQLATRRKSWQKKHKVKASAKPRHVLRQIRDGTPAQRADANRRRDSRNANYGTGSTAAGAAAAC